MKKIFCLLGFGIISSIAQADFCNSDYCGDVYIDKLYVADSGFVYVATSADEKILNCQAESGVYLTLNPDDKGSDRIYSTLLAAQISGRKISTIQVADNSQGCRIQYITLWRQFN